MIRKTVLCAALTQALLSTVAFGQLERQHDVHVHGTATGNMAVDGQELRLELEIPGINLVGFEHAPSSEAEQATLDSTIEFLRAAEWLVADPRGGCEIASVSAHTHGFSEGDDHDHDHDHEHEHEHEHGHEHEHEHEHHDHAGDDAHGHSEFHLVLMMECQSVDRLGWIDLRLFDDYPANELMQIDVLTDTLATQARLSPGNPRIELEQ
ncbi:MAG: DUF2796 domain-containing protein [Wenzhouxiangella sp.]|jgi:hypothetical protein|nr:DUF2796 domain-containing protein [Wenzhouxiangella sp.]